MDRARITLGHGLAAIAVALLAALLLALQPAAAPADDASGVPEVMVEYQIDEDFRPAKDDVARETVQLKRVVCANPVRKAQVEKELTLAAQASSWSRADLKKALLEAFNARSTTVKVSSIKIPVSDSSFSSTMKELRREILEENPEIFWMSTAESWSFKYSGRTTITVVSITSSYAYNDAQVADMQNKYDNAMADIRTWITKAGVTSDVDKAKVVHDWLVRKCVYNKAALTAGGPVNYKSINPWTAYGALVDNKPVCQGYSYAFNAALKGMGIGIGCITETESNGSLHMWSIAQIGGSWYNADVTHDDPLKTGTSVDFGYSDTPRTTYFLKSDAYFRRTADKSGGISFHTSYSTPHPAQNTSLDGKGWTAYNENGAVAPPKNSLSGATCTVYDQTYTGDALTPNTKVVSSGKTLSKGSDYTVSYSNNTEAGTATVTVKGAGAYAGSTKNASFEIEPASIKGASVTGISAKNYTGKALTQSPVVKMGSKTLKSGTDYTVSYKDNTAAGTASLVIKGKGNYTGSITKSFTISKVDISTNPKVTVSNIGGKTYNGKAQTPAVTVSINGTAYTKGTDYSVSYANNTKAGTAKVTITGKGSCTGTVARTFKISAFDLKKAKISGISNKKYTGKAITQNVVVKAGSNTLKKGTDYTVSYKNNKKKGTATVTIKGKGSCTGTVKKTFKIS